MNTNKNFEKYECPECAERKKIIDKFLERYLALLSCTEGQISDYGFTRQMDVVIERLKRIFPADQNGNYSIFLVKPKESETIPCITDVPRMQAMKQTIITIYYREYIE